MNKIWKVISWTFDWLGFFCDRVVIYADKQRLKGNIQIKLISPTGQTWEWPNLKQFYADHTWVHEDGIHEYDIATSRGPQWLTLDEREEEK